MNLRDTLYRERPNSPIAFAIALAFTVGLLMDNPQVLGVWLFVGFWWTFAALCLWSDIYS